MNQRGHASDWGQPPWRVDFEPEERPLPEEAGVAIIGAGFTGLAAAAWLRKLAPSKRVVVVEAGRLGCGASGRTGGIALAGSAVGDLPGLSDVLGGLSRILGELEADCELNLNGVWEIARSYTRLDSPITWRDFGRLGVVNEVEGGTLDAGKLVAGLARAAQRRGVVIRQFCPVRSVRGEQPLVLATPEGELRAPQVINATDGQAPELGGVPRAAQIKFTTAVATAPLAEGTLEAIGLALRKAFYTLDLPYLWGRVLTNNGVVFGCGLVHLNEANELAGLDINSGAPAELVADLERRVRGLHPGLREVEFAHRWGGPLLFGPSALPFLVRHARSPDFISVGGYTGHGVALSVYLGCWAAEVLLGLRELPGWCSGRRY